MEDSELIEELRKYNISLKDEPWRVKDLTHELEEKLKQAHTASIRNTIIFLVILVASVLIQSRISYLHGYGNGSQVYKQKYCAVEYKQSVDYQMCLEEK